MSRGNGHGVAASTLRPVRVRVSETRLLMYSVLVTSTESSDPRAAKPLRESPGGGGGAVEPSDRPAYPSGSCRWAGSAGGGRARGEAPSAGDTCPFKAKVSGQKRCRTTHSSSWLDWPRVGLFGRLDALGNRLSRQRMVVTVAGVWWVAGRVASESCCSAPLPRCSRWHLGRGITVSLMAAGYIR